MAAPAAFAQTEIGRVPKWVGLAYVGQCMKLDPAAPAISVMIGPPVVDCQTMRTLFVKLTGERPEEMVINLLPLPPDSPTRRYLLEHFDICTGLSLEDLDCHQAFNLGGELANLLLPGLGAILNSPVAKFLVNHLICSFDLNVSIPDVDVSFPEIDFGFGSFCWFSCGSSSGGPGGGCGGSGGPADIPGPLWFPSQTALFRMTVPSCRRTGARCPG